MFNCHECGNIIEKFILQHTSGIFCSTECVEKSIEKMTENYISAEKILKQVPLKDRLTEDELTKLGFVIVDIVFKAGFNTEMKPIEINNIAMQLISVLGIDANKVHEFSKQYR